ncbi:DinB family protein [Priestia filamentosa]|uniref:DinB family protein n=1 Tax=Priestia filamentosa TaxID=1402861 RepID=UPI003983C1BF
MKENEFGLVNHILNQYHYHVWANERLFTHLKNIPSSAFHKEITSVFPTLSTALIHIYFTEVIWLKVMEGGKLEEIDEYVNRTKLTQNYAQKEIGEIENLFKQLKAKYQTVFKEMQVLTKRLSIQHPKLGDSNIFNYELIQHLINHATYHRGNITAMLRQLGYKGIATDYVFYLIENKKTVR